MTLQRPLSIREAYIQASSFLAGQQVSEPAACAEILLQYVLECDRTALLLRWDQMFPVEHWSQWQEWLDRKAAGEPVQYITGEQEFYGLAFKVDPSVLIPRPETELLVEEMVRRGRDKWPGGSPLVADIGTGSGAIAVTMAVQCPQWRIWAVDLSEDALTMARRNAAAHDAAERIEWLQGDLLEPVLARRQKVDIVVSNPPYIPTADMPELQREVGEHEPVLALHGGEDGMNCYRRLVSDMKQLPKPPEMAGFEVGQGQAEAVAEMLRKDGGWEHTEVIPDLAGIGRHVIAWR